MKIICLVALGLAALAGVAFGAVAALFCLTGAASLKRLEDLE